MSEIVKYQFFRDLAQLPFVEKILLYGSRARGDHDSRSDIDLAIFCPDATENDWLTLLEITEEADTLLKIDCIRLDRLANEPLKHEIYKHGKTLYKRTL